MAFRDHDNPWLLPGIGWALLSLIVGLSYARGHHLTGLGIVLTVAIAGIVMAVVFGGLSVAVGLLLVSVAERKERALKRGRPGAPFDSSGRESE